MFKAEIARQAAARWSGVPTSPQPLDSLLTAHGDAAELRDQRQRRIARLGNMASTAKAEALARAADTAPIAGRQSDVLASIGYERVLGSRDLLGVDFLELAIALARGIGRVRGGNEYATGVMVGPRLMMTNNHVISDATKQDGWSIDMDYQENARKEMLAVHNYKTDWRYFFYTSKALDYTIIGVEERSDKGRPIAEYPWIKLLGDMGKLEVGDPINIIQHPGGGPKQIAFRENHVIALTTAQPDFLDYTTDTEPGSSGSGCFNDQWELVALHHSSVPKTDKDGNLRTKQNQVWHEGDDANTIQWVGNEGVRVSAIVKDLTAATLPTGAKAMVQSMLTQDAPNPIELARGSDAVTPTAPVSTTPVSGIPVPGIPVPGMPLPGAASDTPPQIAGKEGSMSSGGVSFQVPLTITVSLGGQAVGAVTPVASLASATPLPVVEEKVVIDPDWASRRGYDPLFLGSDAIPLPVLNDEQLKETVQLLAKSSGKSGPYAPYELRYWNYSVLVNRRYRTAWFSAANVDGDERFSLPPRSGDRWFADPRIAVDQQLDQSAFETGIDRGHLTRREDAAWGKSEEVAIKSTNDTFHFTNCSLQASGFNRGRDRWQGLEQFLLEQHAKKDKRRMMVITGPVLDAKSPMYRNDKMSYSVPCPLQYWKVCVLLRESDGTLSSTGFVLGQQDIAQLPGFEAFDVGAAQITLEDLERKTNLNFGDLKDYDHFAQTEVVGTLEKLVNGGKQRFLHDFREIVV